MVTVTEYTIIFKKNTTMRRSIINRYVPIVAGLWQSGTVEKGL